VRFWKRVERPAGIAVKLHEDQVPDFNVPPTLAGKLAVRVAFVRRSGAHIIVDFATGAAWSGISHGPEVVLHAHGEDTIPGDTHLQPEFLRIVVAWNLLRSFEDGGKREVFKIHVPIGRGHQFPGAGNCVTSKVVAKA